MNLSFTAALLLAEDAAAVFDRSKFQQARRTLSKVCALCFHSDNHREEHAA